MLRMDASETCRCSVETNEIKEDVEKKGEEVPNE